MICLPKLPLSFTWPVWIKWGQFLYPPLIAAWQNTPQLSASDKDTCFLMSLRAHWSFFQCSRLVPHVAAVGCSLNWDLAGRLGLASTWSSIPGFLLCFWKCSKMPRWSEQGHWGTWPQTLHPVPPIRYYCWRQQVRLAQVQRMWTSPPPLKESSRQVSLQRGMEVRFTGGHQGNNLPPATFWPQ